ncbi:protein of unknown function [Methanoculleus bourgensis]|uniref:Transposase n=1 Tax=Methanoculleus bourgensis TaxID=83986 RepID=A0A0X3BI22_9EURY|nr:protein of unknown function [Methanoculleus bourgensis]
MLCSRHCGAGPAPHHPDPGSAHPDRPVSGSGRHGRDATIDSLDHRVFGRHKNPVIRYLYAIISFLLKNVWIALLWIHFSPVKQGPRTIEMRAFRFDAFRLIIWEAIRASMGMVKGITVLRQRV